MSDFKKRIEDQVVAIGKSNIPSDEKEVLRTLWIRWKNQDGKVTQKELAELCPKVGGHPKYDSRHEDTTLRKIRQVVRDLRTKRWAPIIADNEGYWIPRTPEEAQAYIDRIEKEVRARVVASFETYKAMRESLGIASDFLDHQEKLLKLPIAGEEPSKTRDGVTYKQFHVSGVGWRCDCPGFKYRKKCRHVEEAAKKTES